MHNGRLVYNLATVVDFFFPLFPPFSFSLLTTAAISRRNYESAAVLHIMPFGKRFFSGVCMFNIESNNATINACTTYNVERDLGGKKSLAHIIQPRIYIIILIRWLLLVWFRLLCAACRALFLLYSQVLDTFSCVSSTEITAIATAEHFYSRARRALNNSRRAGTQTRFIEIDNNATSASALFLIVETACATWSIWYIILSVNHTVKRSELRWKRQTFFFCFFYSFIVSFVFVAHNEGFRRGERSCERGEGVWSTFIRFLSSSRSNTRHTASSDMYTIYLCI